MVLNETRVEYALTKVRRHTNGRVAVRMPWSPGNREALEAIATNVTLDPETQWWHGETTDESFKKLCTMLRHRFTGDIHVVVDDSTEVIAKFHTSWKRISRNELVAK